MLTIRAQRSARGRGRRVAHPGAPTGTYARQLTLGPAVDLEHIDATYTDGVLALTLPVVEAAKPREIPVSVGASSAAAQDAPALNS